MGPIIARYLWPAIEKAYTTKAMVDGVEVATTDYRTVLLVPSGLAFVAAILLVLFFHPPKGNLEMAKPGAMPH